jgi:hypothetical protein
MLALKADAPGAACSDAEAQHQHQAVQVSRQLPSRFKGRVLWGRKQSAMPSLSTAAGSIACDVARISAKSVF